MCLSDYGRENRILLLGKIKKKKIYTYTYDGLVTISKRDAKLYNFYTFDKWMLACMSLKYPYPPETEQAYFKNKLILTCYPLYSATNSKRIDPKQKYLSHVECPLSEGWIGGTSGRKNTKGRYHEAMSAIKLFRSTQYLLCPSSLQSITLARRFYRYGLFV